MKWHKQTAKKNEKELDTNIRESILSLAQYGLACQSRSTNTFFTGPSVQFWCVHDHLPDNPEQRRRANTEHGIKRLAAGNQTADNQANNRFCGCR